MKNASQQKHITKRRESSLNSHLPWIIWRGKTESKNFFTVIQTETTVLMKGCWATCSPQFSEAEKLFLCLIKVTTTTAEAIKVIWNSPIENHCSSEHKGRSLIELYSVLNWISASSQRQPLTREL